ncbi:hypothetical protein ACFOHW_23640 [Paenibacillus abyssi]
MRFENMHFITGQYDRLEKLHHVERDVFVSLGYGQFQSDNIKSLGIEAYFDTIVISEREGLIVKWLQH